MKKIITAINNPKLNEQLKKENNFKIIGKDIQYKEAILETLEKNKNIDIIIISEQILGEIKFEKLIKNIKLINENIKIIFILEVENNDLEKILKENNIKEIYYNNKINLFELIKIINKKEINMEEEIIKLKKIIKENKINYNKLENNDLIENQLNSKKKNINELKNNKIKKDQNKISKIITFTGNNRSGKTSLIFIISQYLAKQKYEVLIVDMDFNKENKILKNIKVNKKIYLNKNKYRRLKNNKVSIINSKNNIKKINNNLYICTSLKTIIEKYNLKNSKIIYQKINSFINSIETNYDFVFFDISKNNFNYNYINKKIIKKSNKNFIVMESNIISIKNIKQLLNKYIKKWKINKKNIYIIENKINFESINKNIVSNILLINNKIIKIKKYKNFNILINNYFKRNILLKKEINKIIKIIKN